MSVQGYTNISIRSGNINIYKSEQKPKESEAALYTLKKIEEIMRGHMQLTSDGQIQDEKSWQTLLDEAQQIRDRFYQKTSQLSGFSRFFGRVSQKEKKITDTITRIENLVHRPPCSIFQKRQLYRF